MPATARKVSGVEPFDSVPDPLQQSWRFHYAAAENDHFDCRDREQAVAQLGKVSGDEIMCFVLGRKFR